MEAFAMVQTACKSFERYTKEQVGKAILDCNILAIIGHPTKDKFKKMLISKLLIKF